jgi:hypothetical protein
VAELPRIGIISDLSRVGLSTWNCGGVSFDNVKLQPLDTKDVIVKVNPSSEHAVSYKTKALDTTYIEKKNHNLLAASYVSEDVCLAQHIVDRRQECKKIRGMPDVGGTADDWDYSLFEWMDFFLLPCQYNYCSECCNKGVKSSIKKSKDTRLGGELMSAVYLDSLNNLESNCLNVIFLLKQFILFLFCRNVPSVMALLRCLLMFYGEK